MTTATRSRIVYRVTCEGWLIGYGKDRDEAEEVRDLHANRNRRNITDGYLIEVMLREEGD
jgi:hypothetical protein